MELSDLEYPLPEPLGHLLSALVDVAKSSRTFTVFYIQNPGRESGAFDYFITNPGGDDIIVPNLKGNPMLSLDMLGLIARPLENDKWVFVSPLAFERIKYERKNRLGKWWTQVWLQRSKAVLAVTATATFILVILQIAKIMQWIK